jgi:rhodanese-related sulfurtransferase
MNIPVAIKNVLRILAAAMVFAAIALSADDAPRIEPEQLKAKIGQPDLALLDVRIASDWGKSDSKIPGAVRVDPHDVSSWAGQFPKDKLLVVYCA